MNDRLEYYKAWKKTRLGKEATKRAWTKYNKTEKKKACVRRHYEKFKSRLLEYGKSWRRKNRAKFNKYGAEYAKRNRRKRKAKDAVNNAIKSGGMKKMPCVVCGEKKSEGHHEDYFKPLNVTWLCKKHHTERHCKK